MTYLDKPQLFYDISVIKEIPILSVADTLGIDYRKAGRNYWCKVRDEKTPSVVLHEDTNYFYDFGNRAHGDVIRFVQYVKDIPPGAAIRFLGETFGLEPCMTKRDLLDRPLTNWEYHKIGLHGDMASKNIAFPIETASLEELQDISSCFKMNLNTLSVNEPDIYCSLICNNASSYVESVRNHYYLAVWNYFHLAYALGEDSIRLYSSEKVRDRFRGETSDLNRMERILYRALKKAGLEPPEPLHHDPTKVIRDLLRGELRITLGNTDKKGIFQLAEMESQIPNVDCQVVSATLPFYSYFDDRLQNFSHCAEYCGGIVTIQFLSTDKEKINPLLEELRLQHNPVLEQRIRAFVERRQDQESLRTDELSFSR